MATAMQAIEVAGRIAVEVESRVVEEEEDGALTVVLRRRQGLRFSLRAGSLGGRRSERGLHQDSEDYRECAYSRMEMRYRMRAARSRVTLVDIPSTLASSHPKLWEQYGCTTTVFMHRNDILAHSLQVRRDILGLVFCW
jgi:hypothetical protein